MQVAPSFAVSRKSTTWNAISGVFISFFFFLWRLHTFVQMHGQVKYWGGKWFLNNMWNNKLVRSEQLIFITCFALCAKHAEKTNMFQLTHLQAWVRRVTINYCFIIIIMYCFSMLRKWLFLFQREWTLAEQCSQCLHRTRT